MRNIFDCVNAFLPLLNKVFIVHGHDGELKEKVVRRLEQQGTDAIILSEQVNRGRTIIEKLEAYSDVHVEIVLFTQDDLGAAKDEKENEKYRARQICADRLHKLD